MNQSADNESNLLGKPSRNHSSLQNTLQQYLSTLNSKDRERYLFLLDRNSKLRDELNQITKVTESILDKERERQRNRIINPGPRNEQSLKEKRQELQRQQVTINGLKNEIKKKKVDIEKNYHVDLLREKEDEIHHLKRIVKELKVEKSTLARIREDQEKIISDQLNPEENLKRKDLVEKVRELKERYRELVEEKARKEKQVYNLHGQVIDEKSMLRDLVSKIQESKHLQATSESPEEVQRKLTEHENEIEELKAKREAITAEYEGKLKNIDKAKKELVKDIDKLEVIIREREKEIRYNAIKLKDIKRYYKFAESQPPETPETLPINENSQSVNIPVKPTDAKPDPAPNAQPTEPVKAVEDSREPDIR